MTLQHINPKNIQLIIFDVDGTLYNQKSLRLALLQALCAYYITKPHLYKDLLILRHFRKERERRPGYECNNLDDEQYEWCAQKTNLPVSRVKNVVQHWMYNFPLQYLSKYKYVQAAKLMVTLKDVGVKIATYSDYPAAEKLAAMRMVTDLNVCSTDKNINCFKPHPKAINYICTTLQVAKQNCLLIGDRVSRDAMCAQNANIKHLILPKSKKKVQEMFVFLTALFQQKNLM